MRRSFSAKKSVSRFLFLSFVMLDFFGSRLYAADSVKIKYSDTDGCAARINAPVWSEVKLSEDLFLAAKEERLYVVEDSNAAKTEKLPAQFEADTNNPSSGKLWWIMPSGKQGTRQFSLKSETTEPKKTMTVNYLKDKKFVNVSEANMPVLCYNYGSTSTPAEIQAKVDKGDYNAEPFRNGKVYNGLDRGDYIHPLYGPDGEVLTDDYDIAQKTHPHHRGVFWSWATLKWKDKTTDPFALRDLWARPSKINRIEGGPVFAIIDVDNEWKWEDKIPVVRERVLIHVFRSAGKARCLDIEIRMKALVDDLSFAGRLGNGYSGFNIRMAQAEGQQLKMFNDPPEAGVRRSWTDYSAIFKNGKGRAGLTIFQNKSNPSYPSKWGDYTWVNIFQPMYPGADLTPMPKNETIVLKYRLWIHPDEPGEEAFSDMWHVYNNQP